MGFSAKCLKRFGKCLETARFFGSPGGPAPGQVGGTPLPPGDLKKKPVPRTTNLKFSHFYTFLPSFFLHLFFPNILQVFCDFFPFVAVSAHFEGVSRFFLASLIFWIIFFTLTYPFLIV